MPHFPCEQAVVSYLRFFDMLRLETRLEETPRPSPENVAYTLGTMSRAVARLCATTNESRVSLFDLVYKMETQEQHLLQSRALLRHTLKTLHNFMVSRITGEAANPAFYTYYTKIVHESVLRHLTDSLAQLTDLENILIIDKFITDVANSVQDADLDSRRRTMCALFAVTATTMAWPMHPTVGITAIAMNVLDASVSPLQSATMEISNPISGVRELEEAMTAASVAPKVEKRPREPPTPQQQQEPATGVENLQQAMPPVPV